MFQFYCRRKYMLSSQKAVWASIYFTGNMYTFELTKGQNKVIRLLSATGLNSMWNDLHDIYIFSPGYR